MCICADMSNEGISMGIMSGLWIVGLGKLCPNFSI